MDFFDFNFLCFSKMKKSDNRFLVLENDTFLVVLKLSWQSQIMRDKTDGIFYFDSRCV